ncbi:MAG TPA: site-specific DNA-methyltransferase [Ottowia sp.]|uniref:site-specific DNA-methyltransferase n=1 Tax=Ottowia sp. TaxID=1898956 RepID=UPI002C74AAC5|nr:site-specific DNA-methyltransferase [Ottowia sp.]HMN21417.1 site-specific DNA-methyltransferase [Ottowia sp.]
MSDQRQQQFQALLLDLLPADHSTIGNGALLAQFLAAAPGASRDDFQHAREALVAAGLAVKGKGRGGSTARATGSRRPDFALDAPAPAATPAPAPVPRKTAARKTAAPAADGAQVLAYRHADRRKNNPEVGLVNADTDPDQPKTRWAYDPHLDPALQFDSARAQAETLIADALASDDPAAMRHALQSLQRMGAPWLQWAGKAERTSFEVDTVSLHVHERIDALSILASVAKRQNTSEKGAANAIGAGAAGQKRSKPAFQPGLFEAPFESVPLRDAVDFYKHERGWANRLVAGDSLLVMNSLIHKEGMAGQVQMIYIDPPYGIKYGSNFQPFVGKRDVKDRADADLTQEPEMIKAFRDTWELGIHSYLTYLRDRLLLARELLSETGSVFVQISDENLHHVREIMDEVFGCANFVGIVSFRKTTGQSGDFLPDTNDYLVWYGKDAKRTTYHVLHQERAGFNWVNYDYVADSRGVHRKMTRQERVEPERYVPSDSKIYRRSPLTSASSSEATLQPVEFRGQTFQPGKGGWKTNLSGFDRLAKSQRLESYGVTLSFRRYVGDFPYFPYSNAWTDTASGGYGADKVYVVQTNEKVIERCMLMTTDPGDLVLDPTCGSGTTAYVAEKWGRRWITCDTSRVAITLAKQRLMTASFDYFALRYPHEGLKGGFIYKTVPHVTLKGIANNAEIDAIYERLHPAIAAALADLNAALKVHAPAAPYAVTEGARKGQKLVLGLQGQDLQEWEVPSDAPADWSAALHAPLAAFHAARQKMQAEMDRSIAANADTETLYDQPECDRTRLRVSGPFTVEAVPSPTVLSIEELPAQASQTPEADASIARSGHTSRQAAWRDELLKTGIRGKGGQMLRFAELEVLPGTLYLHASGQLDSGERVVVSFGPEHGALEQRQVERALDEMETLRPSPKFIVFCAFAFDPEAAKDIDNVRWAGVTLLKAQMNTDLLTEDLKKARASNQSFWLMGQPDVELRPAQDSKGDDGLWQVEVHGFDYFDTVHGTLVSGGKGKIAAWQLDTDYDGRSLFPHQVFFPMAGAGEGWMKLKKDIRAELDEDALAQFAGTVSLPFAAGENRTVAVKIVDDRGIESLKVMRLPTASQGEA